MGDMKYTRRQFKADFPDESACLQYLFDLRFGPDFKCEKCGRSGKFKRTKNRRTFTCGCGKRQVSPTAGTIFNKSEIPLEDYFLTIFLMSQGKNGMAATEIARIVGCEYKTALSMSRRIRSLMRFGSSPFSGTVEVDETYIGGRGAAGKTAVFGISNRDTGKVFAKAVPNVRAKTVMPLIRENVKIGSTVMTDEMASYKRSKEHGYNHHTVRHSAGEYVRGNVYTNSIEGFWGQLKRSVDGTYHAVSPAHLQEYVDEHVFRWNHRNSPVHLFHLLLSEVVRPS